MTSHDDLNQHVASGASVHTGFSLTGKPFALAVVNSCRDIHFKPFAHGYISTAMAVRALLLDHLTGSVTVRAGLHVPHGTEEGLLGEYHLSLAAALGTGDRLGAGLRAGSMTGFALFLHVQLYGFRGTEYRLFKSNMDAGAQIRPLHRRISRPASSAGTASEKVSEYVAKNITKISAAEIKSAEAAARTAIECRMAELIVLASFLRIAENGVCLGSLLEFLFCFFVAGIGVRMVFFGEDPVCFFQCGLVGIPVNAKNLIIISFLFSHLNPPKLLESDRGSSFPYPITRCAQLTS